MAAVQSDIQKLEALLKSATNERQRKMYLNLLQKARASIASNSTPEEDKITGSSPKETQTSASTAATKKKTRNKTASTLQPQALSNQEVTGLNEKEKESSSPLNSKKQSSKKNATSKKQKASSKNGSILVTEELSGTNNLTAEVGSELQVASQLEIEQSNSAPEPNPLDGENQKSATKKKKNKKRSKRKKNSEQATSSPVSFSANEAHFSGVGVIKCTPFLEGEELFVTIDGQKYELHRVVGVRKTQIELLKSELEQNGSREMLLRVYPNITHFKDGSPPYHFFRLVQFYLDEEQNFIASGDTAGDNSPSQYLDFSEEFIFRGIWRVIPNCPSPVITINRNINRLGVYKNISSIAQKYFAKAQDFPVVWDAPVKPFKYNPELKNSEQMPRYFVQVRATLKDGQYIVTEMLSEPTLKIPRFIKPPRKNRQSQDNSKPTKHSEQLDKESNFTGEVVLEPTDQLSKDSDSAIKIV